MQPTRATKKNNEAAQRDLMVALERPHRLGTIGGDLEEQLAHCASFSSVLDQVAPGADRGIDLGTGGGLPGLALAAYRPAMSWTLVDMRAARADEVERTVLRLGYADRVHVEAIEVQQLAHRVNYREAFPVAVARAFGPPSITAECAAGVVKVGGVFVVSEPPETINETDDTGETDQRWNIDGLRRLGFDAPTFLAVDDHRFAVLTKLNATPDRVPRLPPRSNRGWF